MQSVTIIDRKYAVGFYHLRFLMILPEKSQITTAIPRQASVISKLNDTMRLHLTSQ